MTLDDETTCAAEDPTREHAYADREGDLWIYADSNWMYLGCTGRFHVCTDRSRFGPFKELSDDASEGLRRFYHMRKNQ